MPAWVLPAAISAGSGLVNSLFGGKDKWQMSPQAAALWQEIIGEYRQPESTMGYSPEQKSLMLGKVDQALGQKTASNIHSLERRGMASAGQMGGMATEIGNQYGEAAGNIELASAEAARQRKNQLMQVLASLSGQSQFKEGQGIPGLGKSIQDIYFSYLLDKNKGRGVLGQGSPVGDYPVGGSIWDELLGGTGGVNT